jgi:hypothetical protein
VTETHGGALFGRLTAVKLRAIAECQYGARSSSLLVRVSRRVRRWGGTKKKVVLRGPLQTGTQAAWAEGTCVMDGPLG